MAGQTAYTNQALGYPGQRMGMGHQARTGVNDVGAVRQVDTITVSAAAAQIYLFTVDVGGGALPISADFSGGAPGSTTVARDALLAAARAIQAFEGFVAFNPSGAAGITITALTPGVGHTTAEADASLTLANTVANVASGSIPFGRAVVRNTANNANSIQLPSATGQNFMGVLERTHSSVDPNNASPTNKVGELGAFSAGTVIHKGLVVVEVDEAVTPEDNVFFRHTLGGDAGAVGTFRTDADTARADQITNAKFVSVTTGAGLAILSLNEA